MSRLMAALEDDANGSAAVLDLAERICWEALALKADGIDLTQEQADEVDMATSLMAAISLVQRGVSWDMAEAMVNRDHTVHLSCSAVDPDALTVVLEFEDGSTVVGS